MPDLFLLHRTQRSIPTKSQIHNSRPPSSSVGETLTFSSMSTDDAVAPDLEQEQLKQNCEELKGLADSCRGVQDAFADKLIPMVDQIETLPDSEKEDLVYE